MKRSQIAFTIQGVTPLLQNAFTDEAGMNADKGSSSAMRSGDRGTPREQAERKLHLDSQFRVIIPNEMMFASIMSAGVFHKLGKVKVTTAKSSLFPAGATLLELEVPLCDAGGIPYTRDCETGSKWEVDSRAVVNPHTGGRFMCHRPKFESWRVSFTMIVDHSIFDDKFARQLVDDAGLRCGMGDFRPNRKGPFGRYNIVRWDVSAVLSRAA